MAHQLIMKKAAAALSKDAKKYKAASKHATGTEKKHDRVEEKEARAASLAMKKRAKKAHEY